jgi:hypothetical protein
MLIAIDPGSSQSAYVVFEDGQLPKGEKLPNAELLNTLRGLALGRRTPFEDASKEVLAIEFPRVRGMAAQQQLLDTCLVAGRIVEAWGGEWARIDRAHVKLCLCNSVRAKDSNIRGGVT